MPAEPQSSSGLPDFIQQLYQMPPNRHTLRNGLVLVHRPDFSSEVVSIQVWVRTGSIHEGPLLGSGLSHYLEHLMFKGTENRDGRSISREVHAMGGTINAYTSFDRTVYYIDAPAVAFGSAVDLLSDIVLHSILPEAEVIRERDVILREIDMGLDDPDRGLAQCLFRTAFRRHPYREPVIGHRSLFEQVTAEELRQYYVARYVPNNMVISVVGAVEDDSCREAVERSFGSDARGRLAPVLVEEESPQLAPRSGRETGDFKVCRGITAFKIPHLSHVDAPKLDALALALGGGESSVLWQDLRNKQALVHDIDCRTWSPGRRGLLWISFVCDPEKREAVEAGIASTLQTVAQTGFDDTTLEKARRQALAAEIDGRKTMSGQAARLGLGEVVVGDFEFGRNYLGRLERIQPGDLEEVAARYLIPSGQTSVTLEPEDAAPAIRKTANTVARRPFEAVQLENGARLLLQPDARLPKVHFRVVLQGGPLFEPPHARGLTEILAELLTQDTLRHSTDALARRVEGMGATFSASGGNNSFNLALETLPPDVPEALELLREALLEPAFAPDTFATEVRAQVAALREEADDILQLGLRRIREEFFAGHPFGIASMGREADLEALDLDTVKRYYKRMLTAPNLVVAVSGNFDAESVITPLRAWVGQELGNGDVAPIAANTYGGPKGPVERFEVVDREQAVVLQAFPDVGLRSEAFVTGQVLNELFSGMSSRLFERIREDKGMAYYVGSTRITGLETGMFLFYAGTHPDLAGEVVKEIDGEIARVIAGDVLEDELDRCRTRLRAARVMGRQTPGARALQAALNASYGMPVDDEADFNAKLAAVDIEALAAFSRERFVPEYRVRLILGPESTKGVVCAPNIRSG